MALRAEEDVAVGTLAAEVAAKTAAARFAVVAGVAEPAAVPPPSPQAAAIAAAASPALILPPSFTVPLTFSSEAIRLAIEFDVV
jgi:hypothetical protein